MHHGSSVVKMDDLIFMLFSTRSIFCICCFSFKFVFQKRAYYKKMCLRNNISQ